MQLMRMNLIGELIPDIWPMIAGLYSSDSLNEIMMKFRKIELDSINSEYSKQIYDFNEDRYGDIIDFHDQFSEAVMKQGFISASPLANRLASRYLIQENKQDTLERQYEEVISDF